MISEFRNGYFHDAARIWQAYREKRISMKRRDEMLAMMQEKLSGERPAIRLPRSIRRWKAKRRNRACFGASMHLV